MFSTTERYIVEAKSFIGQDAFGVPFPPLPLDLFAACGTFDDDAADDPDEGSEDDSDEPSEYRG